VTKVIYKKKTGIYVVEIIGNQTTKILVYDEK